MDDTTTPIDATEVQAAGELYQQAAQALLLAYQRNKQATRHHSDGAFRAALHHARQSCVHVAQAHAQLDRALELSARLSSQAAASALTTGPRSAQSANA